MTKRLTALTLCAGALFLCGCPPKLDLAALQAAVPPEGTYDVRIVRDDFGVPHIYGKTDADCAYGLAWAHAEDDFATIQEGLFLSRGQYAMLKRWEVLPFDYLVRAFKFRDMVEREYETQLSPEVRAICEAYADGINHYAAMHPEQAKPGVWPANAIDIVVGFVAKTPLFFGMDDEVRRLIEGRPREVSEKTGINQVALATDLWTHMRQGIPIGSNSFAVAPSRTPDGLTHLAVNSHQPWTGPVAWYEARMVSEEGIDMVGGVFPGTPIILHGHNRNLGWAHTVNRPDLVDVYKLEMNPENPNQYKFDGEWRELEVETIELPIRIAGNIYWNIPREALFSVHGPAIRTRDGVYAIRYSTYGDIKQVEHWFRMGKSRNLDEFKAAMATQGVASFNTMYADKEGNIGYIYNGVFPKRAEGYDWKQYLPGNTSETLWTEYYPFDAVPQIWNPKSGYLQNCNNTPFRATDPAEDLKPEDFEQANAIEGIDVMTNRAYRALELLGADDSITADEFYAIKYDTRYSTESMAHKLREEILAAELPDDPVVQEAIELGKAWNFDTDLDNTSTAVAILAMEPVVRAMMFGQDRPDPVKLFVEKAHQLHDAYGTVAVPWRDINRLVRGEVNIPLSGGPDTLHAVYANWDAEKKHLVGVAGDCYVLLVSWNPDGTIHESQSVHQFGSATLDENSPHYADQAPLFAEKKMKPTWLDADALRKHTQIEYTPGDFTSPWYAQVEAR